MIRRMLFSKRIFYAFLHPQIGALARHEHGRLFPVRARYRPRGRGAGPESGCPVDGGVGRGEVSPNIVDEYPKKVVTAQDVPLRIGRLNAMLGTAIYRPMK